MGKAMPVDEQKIDEAVLGLLYLTLDKHAGLYTKRQ
jgi:hypothetical protein